MKSDYKVILFCLLVIGGLLCLFFAVDGTVSSKQSLSEGGMGEVSGERYEPHYSDFRATEKHLVKFDPNTADSTTLLRIGLPPWIVRGIYRYRAKGGCYSHPEDFARVPGLTMKQYRELLPYITIGADYREAREVVSGHGRAFSSYEGNTTAPLRDTVSYPKKLTPTERLSVNAADTAALKRVPGIGSYFARQIVEYRQRLGGYVSRDQLLEIRNFPESALAYLTVPDGNVRRIDINKASFHQLATHPYIGYRRAKVICDYRKLKGRITSLSQLSLQDGFSRSETERMEPYVEY